MMMAVALMKVGDQWYDGDTPLNIHEFLDELPEGIILHVSDDDDEDEDEDEESTKSQEKTPSWRDKLRARHG